MERSGSGGCPAMAFRYNGTLCACNPGRYLVNGSCALFETGGDWMVSSGVSPAPTFLTTVLPIDYIKRFTQSQAVLLEATLVLLLVWFAFCLALRFTRVDNGRSFWFRLRWWISRFDTFYDTKHWLDDNKVVIKRKTELGGTFSVASWILFVGLLSALLYQIITKQSIEVHRVRPANAPDLLSFVNDLEFNITTISSMSCSHLRGLDSLFVDLPNDPAIAVGFRFNLSAKDHADASDLQASLQGSKNGLVNTTLFISYLSDYIVEINKENMMGIGFTVHFHGGDADLLASLDIQDSMGKILLVLTFKILKSGLQVGFLADVGGLYAISLAIFLFFLVQCEARIIKLRHEDTAMRNIVRQKHAQKNWDKLRKYVMYTWGPNNLVDDNKSKRHGSSMINYDYVEAFVVCENCAYVVVEKPPRM
ncbi:hypothetical protein MUK42_15444 [Musa troglodytarum]|uniref:Uncharacterized protein n=1 Tax=Musa troglodytarum TaxID=320322 RepID=A0A9E7KM98_9LILI|nr:hypothetical protein MUK42_15444 [Musa troglodytarum]